MDYLAQGMETEARHKPGDDARGDGQEVITPPDPDPGLAALPWLDVS
jgi:hypothetical protein